MYYPKLLNRVRRIAVKKKSITLRFYVTLFGLFRQ
jgi:hypothetical protein